MIKYFCDKCDKELENYDIFTVTVTPPEFRRWDDDARTGDCALCRNCLDEFQEWLSVSEKTAGSHDEAIKAIAALRMKAKEEKGASDEDRVE